MGEMSKAIHFGVYHLYLSALLYLYRLPITLIQCHGGGRKNDQKHNEDIKLLYLPDQIFLSILFSGLLVWSQGKQDGGKPFVLSSIGLKQTDGRPSEFSWFMLIHLPEVFLDWPLQARCQVIDYCG